MLVVLPATTDNDIPAATTISATEQMGTNGVAVNLANMALSPRARRRLRNWASVAAGVALVFVACAAVCLTQMPDATPGSVLLAATGLTMLISTGGFAMWRGIVPSGRKKDMYQRRANRNYYDF